MAFARNVLIFHQAALGDFALTWPLAMGLGRIHPQSRIIYITSAAKGRLAEKAIRVEWADVEGGWHYLHGNAFELPERNRKLLASAHSIYSFVADAGDVWSANVSKLTPQAQVCCLRPRPAGDYAGHVTDWILEQLAGHVAAAEAMRQMIRSVCERGLRPAAGDPSVVAIHPGSGSDGKCWPAERFIELARRLGAAGRKVRIVLGEVELERWPGERVDALAAVGEIRRPKDYIELFDTLGEAGTFIGNDSGPGHLAGMMGLKTFSLFGRDPATWRPLGPRVQIVRGESLEAISVAEIYERVMAE